MTEWIRAHETLLWWLAASSLVTFVGTLIIVPILVVRIPESYFVHEKRHATWRSLHPVLGVTVLIIKNLLGVVFIAAGLAMLVLPGQGILTLLIGVMLLNFPGKFAMERWLVRHRPVGRTINWLRRKANRPPLRIPTRA